MLPLMAIPLVLRHRLVVAMNHRGATTSDSPISWLPLRPVISDEAAATLTIAAKHRLALPLLRMFTGTMYHMMLYVALVHLSKAPVPVREVLLTVLHASVAIVCLTNVWMAISIPVVPRESTTVVIS